MLRTTLASALLLTVTILVAAPKPKAKPATPKVDSKFVHIKNFAPDKKIVYKTVKAANPKSQSLEMHLFYPKDHTPADTRPAIVFFYGGGWMGGSAGQFYAHARYFANRGFVCVTPYYRTINRHKIQPDTCAKDARDAIRYVRKNAATFGIDPAKIVASGGSAGGHVAACTGTVPIPNTEDNTISAIPCAMALFNPVIDTSKAGYGNNRFEGLDWKLYSPVHHVTKDTPPTIIFHGTNDTVAPFSGVAAFDKKMKELGRPCTLAAYEGAKHTFFNYQKFNGVHFCDTITKMETFFIGLKLMEGPAHTVKQIRELCYGDKPAPPIAKELRHKAKEKAKADKEAKPTRTSKRTAPKP